MTFQELAEQNAIYAIAITKRDKLIKEIIEMLNNHVVIEKSCTCDRSVNHVCNVCFVAETLITEIETKVASLK